MSDAMPLQRGQSLAQGRFVLVKRLGRGGMGEVWLARDERLQEQVALKFLPPEIRGDPVALDDLRRETARSHKLSHPNIVRIHDLKQDPDGTAFIVMEFVDGSTLAALRLQQPSRVLSWDYLRPLVEQLCAALDYAHGEKVIHRDLKPANMMVDSRGRLKLADFGIAAVASDSMSRISQRHSTSGTLPYMSPQQLTGKRPLATDDIYALGATLYELLTSKVPFHSGDITHQVLHVPPEPMDERLAALEIENPVPPDAAALIMACLAKEPGQRPQSARVVAEWIGLELDVKPSAENLAAALVPQTPASPAAAASRPAGDVRSRPAVWGRNMAAVATVVLVIAGAFWLRKGTHRGDHSNASVTAKVPAQTEPTSELKAPPAGTPPKAAANPAPALTEANASQPRQRWTNSWGMVFVPVPGTSVMFSIWDTRVQDFAAFAGESGYETQPMISMTANGWKYRGDTWQRPGSPQGLTDPVCGVNFTDADAFCRWLTDKERKTGLLTQDQNYRLPTDAEWSVAVGNALFPWGDSWPPPPGAGNYPGSEAPDNKDWAPGWPMIPGYRDNYPRASPVGAFQPNRYGLYDMGGNVWQMVEDFQDTKPPDRYIRGGSWREGHRNHLLASYKQGPTIGTRPRDRVDDVGFRCVLSYSLETTNQVSTTKVLAQAAVPPPSANPPSISNPTPTATEQRDAAPANAPGSSTNPVHSNAGKLDNPLAAGGQTPQPVGNAGLELRRLASPGWKSSWAPDGKRLVYGSPRGAGLEILDLETGKVTDLSKVGKDAAWSPNGRYIAYVVEPSFDSYQEDVCLSDQTGGNVRMLTEGAYPGWSGDSRFLYFYSRSKHRILSIDVSQPSAQATVFFDHPSSQYPAVSPDGSMVAFGTAGKLVIAKARTGEQLWNWPVVNARGLLPAWSPDGKLVGFGGYDGDELGLWVFRISSGTASCIVRGPCTMPAWSNDGEKLAFDYRPKKQDKWEVWEALPPLNGRKPDDASPFWRTNQF